MTGTKQDHRIASGMIAISGGDFSMGSDDFYSEERPKRPVRVAAFEIDIHCVSNRDFGIFVADTGYVTQAECPIDPIDAPNMPAEYFTAGSLVFQMTDGPVPLNDFTRWWAFIPGACWNAPEGPGSTIKGRLDHPVVHVSYFDALAYASWAGKSLPTEKEWEFAAKGGKDTVFPWGDTLDAGNRQHANTWIGRFPFENLNHKDAPFTEPVDSYEPTGFGTFSMIGNVWEWTSSPFENHPSDTCCAPSFNIAEGDKLVLNGGSHLCAPSYCQRYRCSARSPQESRSATSHTGFRCVRRIN